MSYFLLKAIWKKIKKINIKNYAGRSFPQDIEIIRDIPYGPHGADNLLDAMWPAGVRGLLPVIVNIHGGGWVAGSKEIEYGFYAPRLAGRGFAVLNINYRLAPEHILPDMLEDIFAVMRFIEERGEEFHCDKSRVFLEGDSAGAHLAALAAGVMTCREYADFYKLSSPIRPLGLGLNCGVYHPRAMLSSGNKSLLEGQMKTTFRALFGCRRPAESVYADMSSVTGAVTENFPPCYVMGAKADPLFPQTELLNAQLRAQGVEHIEDVYESPKLYHVFHLDIKMKDESESVLKTKTDFFTRLAERADV